MDSAIIAALQYPMPPAMPVLRGAHWQSPIAAEFERRALIRACEHGACRIGIDGGAGGWQVYPQQAAVPGGGRGEGGPGEGGRGEGHGPGTDIRTFFQADTQRVSLCGGAAAATQ